MRPRLPHLPALGLAALAALPASAGAVSFGAALSQPVSTTARVKLDAAGRRLAGHRRRVTAYAVATVVVQVVTTKVTLEAPRQ